MGRAEVLRLDFCWGDLVVDTVAIATRESADFVTPHGKKSRARWIDDENGPYCQLVLEGREIVLLPGGLVDEGGLTICCYLEPRQRARSFARSVDSNLLHASMISMAAQVCAVAALWLTPKPALEPESGGGVAIEEMRRYISAVPSGKARKNGPPRFVARGEAPDEAERILDVKPARGRDSRRSTSSTKVQSMSEALDAIVRELNNGDSRSDLTRAVGDLNWIEPTSAAIAQAGFGGLPTPRPVVASGVGSGIIGVGDSQLRDTLRRAIREADVRVEDMRREREDRLPVVPETVSEESVTSIDAIADLPDEAREHIVRAVRDRQNSIRYCYESWGLPRAPKRTGRLLLEFTLQSDGHPTDIRAEIDEPSLRLVAECAREQAGEWFLGSALSEPRRLQFSFFLQPRSDQSTR